VLQLTAKHGRPWEFCFECLSKRRWFQDPIEFSKKLFVPADRLPWAGQDKTSDPPRCGTARRSAMLRTLTD
jgi:hypothetical protein